MKFSLQDLKKAIEQMDKDKSSTEINIVFDSRNNLVISYSTTTETDETVIKIYPVEIGHFAEITKTKRL